MNFETNSLGITSGILMTMSKIPALSQKVLAEWLRMPERQELFPGLPLCSLVNENAGIFDIVIRILDVIPRLLV